ncbi:hypothetical protein [Hathewaya massiliensis]|uniref:hypothetical protein n=1 Tax=Hathewaya massiliensis TaxID=1964382 RepID=UPI0011584C2E|nr:hypothetical protein [Hathewaya massiliensis]
MREIMTRAHQIAKTLEGDYSARLSMALKLAWVEAKGTKGVVVVKETAKAKCLVIFFEDILGNERKMNVWFPNGWLENNNMPKMWALKKKAAEIRSLHPEWDLVARRVLVA